MKTIGYLAIYEWGEDPDAEHGNCYGTQIHTDLQMLFAYDPEAIAFFEVEIEVPTQNEFKRKHNLSSGAI